MKQLQFVLFSGTVVQVPCDTVVVPIPSDERPLRREAGWVDWRVCGAISRQLVNGYVGGVKDEIVLLPAPKPIAAERLLLVGLGPSKRLQARGLQRAIRLACEKILSLRGGLALLALPAAVDFSLDAQPIVRGCLTAVAGLREDARLCFALALGLKRARTLEAALAAVADDAREKQVEIGVDWPEAEVEPTSIGATP